MNMRPSPQRPDRRVTRYGWAAAALFAAALIVRLFYLYETIKFSFEPSVDLPGKIGLYRTDGLGTKEELLAPFDTAASFAFLMGQDMSTVSTVTSGQLQDVRGLELRLIGESYFVPQGEAEPQIFDLRTSVTFRNVVN